VFRNVCGDFGATLVECNREDDRMHLLVEYPPKMLVSALMNSLRSVSARILRQWYRSGPTATTCGLPPISPRSAGAPLAIIKQYMEQ
jgi:putative transposase